MGITEHSGHLWAVQNEIFARLAKVSSVASLSPEEKRAYDEDIRVYRDNNVTLIQQRIDGERAGKRAGRKEGKKEGKKEVAQKMLAKGYALDEIAEITGIARSTLAKMQGGK